MKKYFILIMAVCAAALSGCNSTTTKSYADAQIGNTKVVDMSFSANTQNLHKAVLAALADRKWTILDKSNPIKAQIDRKGQLAKLSILVSDGRLDIDTAGSMADGQPYVPHRYIDFLLKSVRAHQ